MKFAINGLMWDMCFVSSDSTSMNDENGVYFGYTNYLNQTVMIRSGLPKELTRRAVMHELAHCIRFSYGFVDDVDYSEEQMCCFISNHADTIISLTDQFLEKDKS